MQLVPVASDIVRSLARRFDRRTVAPVALVALGFVVLATFGFTPMWGAPLETFLSRLVHTTVASLFVLLAVLLADELVERGLRALPTYAVAVAVSAVVGSLVGFEARGALGLDYSMHRHGVTRLPAMFAWVRRVDLVVILWIVGGLGTVAHVSRRNALVARRRQHEAEEARTRAQRRTLESELQALQARVEPAFLFETLDGIRRLYRSDAAAAGQMLEDLIVYLRAALPHLRESASSVRQEVTLACAWLDIMRRSMKRLEVGVDVAPDAEDARLPALIVLPLTQHAVGGATSDGAGLCIASKVRMEKLHLIIETSTTGFAHPDAPPLVALRERLHALYGERASLVTPETASGSRAELELPLEPSMKGASASGKER